MGREIFQKRGGSGGGRKLDVMFHRAEDSKFFFAFLVLVIGLVKSVSFCACAEMR